MKYLLTGVAIAAALAIAAPTLAQTKKASGGAGRDVGRPPAAAAAPAAATPAAATPAAAPAPMAHAQRHHRVVHHHMAMYHHGRMAPGDAMTEQLNREELARIQGGGMPPPPPPPGYPPAGQGGPRASGH